MCYARGISQVAGLTQAVLLATTRNVSRSLRSLHSGSKDASSLSQSIVTPAGLEEPAAENDPAKTPSYLVASPGAMCALYYQPWLCRPRGTRGLPLTHAAHGAALPPLPPLEHMLPAVSAWPTACNVEAAEILRKHIMMPAA